MRAREESERPGAGARLVMPRPGRAAEAAPGTERAASAPAGPAAVLSLQRSAGNAAVTRALGAQRHVHGRGCGHGLTVQRAGATRPPGILANDAREFGPPDLLMQPDQDDQRRLENAFPRSGGVYDQFPDPRSLAHAIVGPLTMALNKVAPKGETSRSGGAADWVKQINPRRDKSDRYRRNCIDAARSFLASWSGNPTVAAGTYDPGRVEGNGPDRTKRWLKTEWKTTEAAAGTAVADVWQAVANRLLRGGHGSSAIVVFKREETGFVHAVNGVNYKGEVVWIDPQMGRVSGTPMYNGVLFMTITLDPDFKPIEAPAPLSTDLPMLPPNP